MFKLVRIERKKNPNNFFHWIVFQLSIISMWIRKIEVRKKKQCELCTIVFKAKNVHTGDLLLIARALTLNTQCSILEMKRCVRRGRRRRRCRSRRCRTCTKQIGDQECNETTNKQKNSHDEQHTKTKDLWRREATKRTEKATNNFDEIEFGILLYVTSVTEWMWKKSNLN